MPYIFEHAPHHDGVGVFNKMDTTAFCAYPHGEDPYLTTVPPDGFQLIKQQRSLDFALVKDGFTYFKYVSKLNSMCHKLPDARTEGEFWWDVRMDDIIKPFARRFFFDIFYLYGNMTAGHRHTLSAEALWIEQLEEVFKRNHYVYVLDARNSDYYTYTPVLTYQEFLDKWVNFCWGCLEGSYDRTTILITVEPLPNTEPDQP